MNITCSEKVNKPGVLKERAPVYPSRLPYIGPTFTLPDYLTSAPLSSGVNIAYLYWSFCVMFSGFHDNRLVRLSLILWFSRNSSFYSVTFVLKSK